MKTKLTIGLNIFVIAAVLMAGAATVVAAPQGVELSEVASMTAKVVAIDRVDRHVTLRRPDGSDVTIEVDKAAQNFDQIAIGDNVKVEYYESVALFIGRQGQQPDVNAGVATARAAKGEKPAVMAVETVEIVATVQEINKEKRTVTLKGPHGKLTTIKVDKSAKGFDNLKKGDAIHVRHTEAVAISVEKPCVDANTSNTDRARIRKTEVREEVIRKTVEDEHDDEDDNSTAAISYSYSSSHMKIGVSSGEYLINR